MKFDENLASIHAYLCADGYVIKNPPTQKHKYYIIGLRNQNTVLLEDFQEKFYSYFKEKPWIQKNQRCAKGSKVIYFKLINNFGSFHSYKWTMPDLSEELLPFWIKSFFDCEAWVNCQSHKNRMIGLDSVNEKGLIKLTKALSVFNIKSNIRKRKNRNTSTLSIYGKENLIKFRKKIGFLHPNKKKKLDEAINDYVSYYWDFKNENYDLFKHYLKEKAKIKKDNGTLRIYSNKKINLITLSKLFERYCLIKPFVSKQVNGRGTIYYELAIFSRAKVKEIIHLLNNEEKLKWKKLILKKQANLHGRLKNKEL